MSEVNRDKTQRYIFFLRISEFYKTNNERSDVLLQ